MIPLQSSFDASKSLRVGVRVRVAATLGVAWLATSCDGTPAVTVEATDEGVQVADDDVETTDEDAPDAATGSLGEGLTLTREELLDPQTCKECHPRHYREWKSSMHAYASEDPVFRAMNQRGQEETDGELGDFCVRCHAPMAVIEGATSDGLNLDEVDESLHGVTCYFCHSALGVETDHNNGLILDGDGEGTTTMYGGISDPKQPSAHYAAYSKWQDGSYPESARACGACHDIVTESGVHLERTYSEYKTSLFAGGDDPLTCISCHMAGRSNVPAADDPDVGVPTRTVHEHLWAAVDVALTPWHDEEGQRQAVNCELANGARVSSLRATEEGQFIILLETNAAHNQPSGATQDRRLWVEFVAYDEDDEIVFETGRVADDEIVDKPADDPDFDPYLRVFRGHIYDDEGDEVHMFWEAAKSEEYPKGYTIDALPPGTLEDPEHHVEIVYDVPLPLPERVTVRARMRPMGLDVLDDLIESGHLDPKIRDAMPTFDLGGTMIEWTSADGFEPVTSLVSESEGCNYRCEFDPKARGCQ